MIVKNIRRCEALKQLLMKQNFPASDGAGKAFEEIPIVPMVVQLMSITQIFRGLACGFCDPNFRHLGSKTKHHRGSYKPP